MTKPKTFQIMDVILEVQDLTINDITEAYKKKIYDAALKIIKICEEKEQLELNYEQTLKVAKDEW